MLTNMVEYEGEFYEYVFAKSGNPLNREDTDNLMLNVIKLDRSDKENKYVQGENFDGSIIKKGPAGFGQFYGNLFEFNLDIQDIGRRDISIIFMKGIGSPN